MAFDLKKLAGSLATGGADGIGGLLNTALSLVKDKTRDADTSFVNEKIKKGVSVSSKRVLNLTGTAAMLTMALGDMASNGISWENVALAALGALYSVGMAYMTGKAEA